MKVHYGWCVFEPEEIGGSEFMDTVDRFGCMVPIEHDDGKIPLFIIKECGQYTVRTCRSNNCIKFQIDIRAFKELVRDVKGFYKYLHYMLLRCDL